jgi:hypothetical protein
LKTKGHQPMAKKLLDIIFRPIYGRFMKTTQSSSRETVQKILIALVCLGVSALAGCFLPTPFEDSHARVFDAALSVALAVFVWCGFHLFEPRCFSRKWATAELAVVPVIWLLIMLAFAVWFYHLEQDRYEIFESF